MAAADAQSLVKLAFNLKIIPIQEDSLLPSSIPFIAMFNPDNFTIHEESEYENKAPAGSEGGTPVFKRIKPRTFTMEFIVDGTGVNINSIKIPVVAQVALFRLATSGIKGSTHKPPRLLVQYGTFINFCRLMSSDINYTMFDMFGLPIRAKITARFSEEKTQPASDILNMLSSPDLTHLREVQTDGELLPMMCHNIYENQNYYLQVAKVNKIKNFRRLKAGTQIFFPPLS
jgi:Contractile injection system tube protein